MTTKIIFNRKGRLNTDGRALVQIRVTHNRQTKYVGTGIYVKPDEWSDKQSKVVKHPQALKLNAAINKLRSDLELIEIDAVSRNQDFNISMLDAGSHNAYTRVDHFILSEIDKSAGLAISTISKQKTFVNLLKRTKLFTTLGDVDVGTLSRFHAYFEKHNYAPSTFSKFHAHLRRYLQRAVDQGLIKRNPYSDFKVEAKIIIKRRYLTTEQLTALRDKTDLHPRIEFVRDVFLFSCYTGLAYSDVAALTPGNLHVMDGEQFIIINRRKTKGESIIPLLPLPAAIIERYRTRTRLMPVMSNQKFNAYLKELQVICNINTTLTHHVARHTFATTVTLERGVPLESVSRMLGHDSIKSTQIYAKITKSKLLADMKKLNS